MTQQPSDAGGSNSPKTTGLGLDRLRGWIGRVVVVKPGELGLLLMSFATVFFMFSSYSVLRPVRETMGLTSGVEKLPALFWGTFVAMLAVQPIYGWLTSRYRRSVFLPWVYVFFALNLVAFWIWFVRTEDHTWIARVYYVWVSVFNLFVVAVFWSLMADLFDREQAGRMFGFIAAGLSCGGIFGPFLSDRLARPIGTINLLLVGAGLLVISLGCMMALLAIHRRSQRGLASAGVAGDGQTSPIGASDGRGLGGGVLAGFRQVARSPYLLGIASFVFLMTWASTFLYLEQQKLVSRAFTSIDERTVFFARVDFWVQLLSLSVQTLLFARLYRRLGFVVMIMAMPVLLGLGFVAIAVQPVFATVLAVGICRRIGDYSLTRPCRDMLWTVVPREEKYKAKAIVDTFVYRGGDAVSATVHAGLTTGVGLGLSGIGVFGALTAIVWGAVAWALARRVRAGSGARTAGGHL